MEQIIDVLYKLRGHTYDQVYDLIFTDYRIVVVQVQNPNDVPINYSPWTFLIGGWFDRSKEQQERFKKVQERRQEEQKLSLDELLLNHPENFEILYQDISSVELTHSFLGNKLKLQITRAGFPTKTISFTVFNKQFYETKMTLEKVLSSKIKNK